MVAGTVLELWPKDKSISEEIATRCVFRGTRMSA